VRAGTGVGQPPPSVLARSRWFDAAFSIRPSKALEIPAEPGTRCLLTVEVTWRQARMIRQPSMHI
jgi:hypothetical protein